MKNKILQSVITGIAATAVMTLVMAFSQDMGMPKMSPPVMLSSMLGVPIAIGWLTHFLIGIIFAAGYVFMFMKWLRNIPGRAIRGAVYGIIAFLAGQAGLALLEAFFGSEKMPAAEGSTILIITGSVIGHIVFGIVTALMAALEYSLNKNHVNQHVAG